MPEEEADLPLREGRRGQAALHIAEVEELAAAYYDQLDVEDAADSDAYGQGQEQ